jgi:hypothetical protein
LDSQLKNADALFRSRRATPVIWIPRSRYPV